MNNFIPFSSRITDVKSPMPFGMKRSRSIASSTHVIQYTNYVTHFQISTRDMRYLRISVIVTVPVMLALSSFRNFQSATYRHLSLDWPRQLWEHFHQIWISCVGTALYPHSAIGLRKYREQMVSAVTLWNSNEMPSNSSLSIFCGTRSSNRLSCVTLSYRYFVRWNRYRYIDSRYFYP